MPWTILGAGICALVRGTVVVETSVFVNGDTCFGLFVRDGETVCLAGNLFTLFVGNISGCGALLMATGIAGLNVRFDSVGLLTFDSTTCGGVFVINVFFGAGPILLIGLTVILLLTGGNAPRVCVTVISLLFVSVVTALRLAIPDDVETTGKLDRRIILAWGCVVIVVLLAAVSDPVSVQ